MRALFTLLHRYVGLVMAGFLLLAGLTGALLAWYDELDGWVNRSMMHVEPPNSSSTILNPLVLREQIQKAYPSLSINAMPLIAEPNRAVKFSLRGAIDLNTGKPAKLVNDEVFINPYTGQLLGARKRGDITQGMSNLMPFIYRLHYSLALDKTGEIIFGIVALLWTLDCFVGAYLTFPASGKKMVRSKPRSQQSSPQPKPLSFWEGLPVSTVEGKAWLRRWWKSWKIRWQGGSYKVNFDLHRAGGLWVWAMLFVLAWSSVAFNLREEAYLPVMKSMFTFADESALPKLKTPQAQPGIGWPQALTLARSHMAAEAKRVGFAVIEEQSLRYDPNKALYRYFVKSSVDIRDKYGSTGVYFDANTGALKFTRIPTGRYAGDTVTNWLTSLHMAKVWGLPFRIFVCVMGLAVVMVTVTGVIVWWRKRASRTQYALQHARRTTPV